MFVYNNFTNDSRVQKEAETLIQSGYETTVMALLDQHTAPLENRNSINIIRINVKPWNLALVEWLRNPRLLKPDCHRDSTTQVSLHAENLPTELSVPASNFRKDNVTGSNSTAYDKGTAFSVEHPAYESASVTDRENMKQISTDEQTFYCQDYQTKFGGILHKCLVLMRLAHWFYSRLIKHIQMIFLRGVKFVLMPFHRYFCFISYYRKAYNLTANNTYDIYHAHDLNTLPVAYMTASETMPNWSMIHMNFMWSVTSSNHRPGPGNFSSGGLKAF